ncbi:MAG: hypothetical protein AAF747_10010 [Planctomycetota bacterium]
MRAVKRIEIIIEKPHIPKVRSMLDSLGITSMTIFESVAGFGDRGDRIGSGVSDAQVMHALLTTCQPDQIDDLSAQLEPLLRRLGGLCLISDATVIRD